MLTKLPELAFISLICCPKSPKAPKATWRATGTIRNVEVPAPPWTYVGPMRDPNDVWLVRMPDGKVVRAKSTAAVRRHVDSGLIPVESWVRRSPEEDWVTLEWAVEFTDL